MSDPVRDWIIAGLFGVLLLVFWPVSFAMWRESRLTTRDRAEENEGMEGIGA